MISKWTLLLLVILVGSSSAHEHRAPHQGTLVELGQEAAHLELVLDARAGALTVYVLDGEAEQPVRIAAPRFSLRVRLPAERVLELEAVANPLTGETAGDTSQFRVQSKHLEGISRFEGSIPRVSVRGADFDDVPIRFPGGAQ